ncbi:MAG: beta-lactamase [Chitinophagaceae bacterium]|nr:beta-lactamase [Chitinophagaceae bacterium]
MFTDEELKSIYPASERNGHKLTLWSGGVPGFSSEFHSYFEDRQCIIVLSNNVSTVSRLIAEDIGAILYDKPYEIVEVTNFKQNPKSYNSLEGVYKFGDNFFFPGAEITIKGAGEQLIVSGGRGTTILIPLGENKYLDRSNWAVMNFLKDENNVVNKIDWKYGSSLFVAKRVK